MIPILVVQVAGVIQGMACDAKTVALIYQSQDGMRMMMGENNPFDLDGYLNDDYLHAIIQPIVAAYMPKLYEHFGCMIDQDDERTTLDHVISCVRTKMQHIPYLYNDYSTFMWDHNGHSGTDAHMTDQTLPAGTVIRIHGGLGMAMTLTDDTQVRVSDESWDIEQAFAIHAEHWRSDPTYRIMAQKRSIDARVARYARKELEWIRDNITPEMLVRDSEGSV